MVIMGCRYLWLQAMLAGYAKTGVELVGFDGKSLTHAGCCAEDPGLFYFVPKLVRFFNISLDSAIDLFFYSILFVSSVLALVGFFLLSKSWAFRIVACLGMIGFFLGGYRGMGDLYLINAAIVFAIVPLALYFFRAHQKSGGLLGGFLFASGVAIEYANQMRAHSGLPVFLFLALGFFFLCSISYKKKFLLFVLLCAGMLLPKLHFRYVVAQRNKVLGEQMLQYKPQHALWHAVYAGFGFLNNQYGIAFDDDIIIKKVCDRHPSIVYPSKTYEQAARKDVFQLAREHPSFVLRTLFAKFGILLLYLFLFGNIGLLAAFFYRKPWILELMFWVGIALASLPGLIALPVRYYLLGMLAFVTVYALISIEYAICQGAIQDIFKRKNKKHGK